jgi:hypothetical protein
VKGNDESTATRRPQCSATTTAKVLLLQELKINDTVTKSGDSEKDPDSDGESMRLI